MQEEVENRTVAVRNYFTKEQSVDTIEEVLKTLQQIRNDRSIES